jgi:hypothetical protein
MNKPLIDAFVFTGEMLNPYRCESCTTKGQRSRLERAGNPVKTEAEAAAVAERPECCRKCGVSF